MYYQFPDDKDFHFNSNGYKCAVGIDFPADITERSQYQIIMMKTVDKTVDGSLREHWELVHYSQYINSSDWASSNACMTAFLAEANPKLKSATGSEVPPMPADFLEQLEWLVKFGLAFNAQTGEVYIK